MINFGYTSETVIKLVTYGATNSSFDMVLKIKKLYGCSWSWNIFESMALKAKKYLKIVRG
jgi:hypothetical protein